MQTDSIGAITADLIEACVPVITRKTANELLARLEAVNAKQALIFDAMDYGDDE